MALISAQVSWRFANVFWLNFPGLCVKRPSLCEWGMIFLTRPSRGIKDLCVAALSLEGCKDRISGKLWLVHVGVCSKCGGCLHCISIGNSFLVFFFFFFMFQVLLNKLPPESICPLCKELLRLSRVVCILWAKWDKKLNRTVRGRLNTFCPKYFPSSIKSFFRPALLTQADHCTLASPCSKGNQLGPHWL